LVSWVKERCQQVLEIIKRSDKQKGFEVLPHRRVVERTFGWFNRYRRLAKDYERSIESSESALHCHDPLDACTAREETPNATTAAMPGTPGLFFLIRLIFLQALSESRRTRIVCPFFSMPSEGPPRATLLGMCSSLRIAWGEPQIVAFYKNTSNVL
jgi:DDE family transposase